MWFVLKSNIFFDEEYNWFFKISEVNFLIVILILILFLIILIVEIQFKFSLNLLLIILFYLIIVNNFIVFFLFYEIIFILIIFVIILLGYSYERLIAAFLIMFYSFLFSRPILIILILFDKVFLIKEWMFYSLIIKYFFVGSFIVKFPVFGFHYWLPVAHVEASTIGSILLAGVLLKAGCIGLLYVITYINFIIKFHWITFGCLLIILIILNLRDLKIIIAYSSVAHMSIVFYILMTGVIIGKKGAVYIIFYHGFISPLIFWVVGILVWIKTRSLLVVKIISFSYIFILILFILCILNIGFPPFIGFIREILILKSLVTNYLVMIVLVFRVLFRCYYNVYFFWCFNGFMGLVFKINFFYIDLFIFLVLSLILNFYWLSNYTAYCGYVILFNSDYIYYCKIFIINFNNSFYDYFKKEWCFNCVFEII